MSKLPNLTAEAAAFMRQAQQQIAQLQRAMKSAEDNVAGLSRAIKDPVIRTRRQTTKKSTSGPSLLVSLGTTIAGGYLGDTLASTINPDSSSSFYQSSAQKAARLSAMSLLGQRIS